MDFHGLFASRSSNSAGSEQQRFSSLIPAHHQGTCQIFVGGLPKVPNEMSIRGFFSQFGQVKSLLMKLDENGDSRGYCFITFDNPLSVKLVMENHKHNNIDGKWVDCKPAEEKPTNLDVDQQGIPLDGELGGRQAKHGLRGKPGDWMCPMCGDLVFAWRNNCNICGFGLAMAGRQAPTQPGSRGQSAQDAKKMRVQELAAQALRTQAPPNVLLASRLGGMMGGGSAGVALGGMMPAAGGMFGGCCGGMMGGGMLGGGMLGGPACGGMMGGGGGGAACGMGLLAGIGGGGGSAKAELAAAFGAAQASIGINRASPY